MNATVQAGSLRRIIDVAAGQGACRSALWTATGVTPGIDDRTRISAGCLFSLWSVAAGQTQGNLPIAVTEHVALEKFGVFGFAVMTAPDCLSSLQTVAELFPIVTDSGHWTVELDERSIRIVWDRPRSACPGQHLSTEATVAHFVVCLRQTLGHDVPSPRRVLLRHGLTPERRVALRNFMDCPLVMNADRDLIEWDRELSETQPRLANGAIHAHFLRTARPLVSAVTTPQLWSERVARQLACRISEGDPPIEQVATALGTSSRTLRRRLGAEGANYRKLIDQVRRELARELLSAPERSITNVALELGFSDSTAFARAFRRWYGHPPRTGRSEPQAKLDRARTVV